MTNHQDGKALFAHLDYFQVHFGDQWACGVIDLQATGFGITPNFLRNPVGTKHHNPTAWHFRQLFHKDRALGA